MTTRLMTSIRPGVLILMLGNRPPICQPAILGVPYEQMSSVLPISAIGKRALATNAVSAAALDRSDAAVTKAKPPQNPSKPSPPPPVSSPAPVTVPTLATPLSVLQMATQPSSDNSTASADYRAMKTAMLAGNEAAAQQAYKRLQTDLALTKHTGGT